MRLKPNSLKLHVSVILLLEILMGVILIAMTVYYHRILGVYLGKTGRTSFVAQLTNIYLLGFQLILCYCGELIVWRYVWKIGLALQHTKLLAIWNGFCLLLLVGGSTTIWFQYISAESLELTAKISLFNGMDLYFSDPEWKLLWDKIQYNNECCGINGYEDWKEAAWMPEQQDNCQTMYDADTVLSIPYACCKRSVKSCFQYYTPHFNEVTIPHINSSQINANGCLQIFNEMMLLIIYGFIVLYKLKRKFVGLTYGNGSSDEQPLIVVKHPRNVRCITLTDEQHFDNFDEEVEEDERISVLQEMDYDAQSNIFLH